MEGSLDRNDVVARYNESCAAFHAAVAAWRDGKLDDYEGHLRQAATAAAGALEWGLKVYLEQTCAAVLSEEDREKIRKGFFRDLVELTTKANPPLDRTTRQRFQEYRGLRNHSEHGGTIPGNAKVFSALVDIRGFLINRLLVEPERLRSALPADIVHEGSTPAPSSPLKPVTRSSHRDVGPEKWVTEILAAGIERARHEVGERYDATLDSLALEARALLTRDAMALALNGSGPAATIPHVSESVEEEMQRILTDHSATNVGAAALERLRHLLPLLSRRSSLSIAAGWLERQDSGLRFAHRLLPSALLGHAIATRADQAALLRDTVSTQYGWAEAAWAAVASGDHLDAWCTILLAEAPSPVLLDRVVATCAAFAGLGPDAVLSADAVAAFRLCAATLIWFAPRRIAPFNRPLEPDSPWFLPAEIWQRCLLDLAHAADCFSEDARLIVDLAACQAPPEPLRGLISILNLSPRLPEDMATALLMFCSPRQTLGNLPLTGEQIVPLFNRNSGVELPSETLTAWFREHGIPALYAVDRGVAARLLSLPSETHPAGYLLHQTELLDDWFSAWKLLSTTAEAELVVEAFVKALPFLSGRSDEETLAVVAKAFQRLERRGLAAQVATQVRKQLQPLSLDPKVPGSSVATEMLRYAAFTPAEWTEIIEQWTTRPSLAWQTLLAAGAPHTAIARWCIAKFAVREKIPPGLREGPHMVGSEGVVPTQSGDWQLAFQQAPEALDWILSEGSAEAIGILADACLGRADDTASVDPIVAKWQEVHLSVPLSQVIWGKVIGRPAGRDAFLSFIERGRAPGPGPHFLDDQSFPGSEDSLWLRIADGIAKARHDESAGSASPSAPQVQSEGEIPSSVRAAASRLLRVFEQRLAGEPWLASLNGHPVRGAIVTLVALCGVDVSAELRSLNQELLNLKITNQHLAAYAAMLGNAVSSATFHLCCHHPNAAAQILDEALASPMLSAMRRDDSRLFWLAVLAHHGVASVLRAIDELAWRDIGLGLFDALKEVDETILRQRHLRPEMLRATLVRSAQQKFRPTPEFWKAAWATERSEREIPELVNLPDGEWLTQLLVQSAPWSPESRSRLLRHLSFFSADKTVRTRCTRALGESSLS